MGPEYYVNIMSFVDKSQLEPGWRCFFTTRASPSSARSRTTSTHGSVMKVDKAPLESYADVGGLEDQIQEIKEAVELP